jgi:hypothetical protein
LTAVGEVAAPVRTPWGWDVIYLAQVTPAVAKSLAEAEPELRDLLFYGADFDGYRQTKFLAWASGFGKGSRIEVFAARIPPASEEETGALMPTGGAPPRLSPGEDRETSAGGDSHRSPPGPP